MYGNESTFAPVNGQVSVDLSDRPVYMQGDLKEYVRGAIPRVSDSPGNKRRGDPDTAWLMKSPYYQRGNVSLTRGYDNTFSVDIYNYGSRTLEGALQVQGIPESWFSSASAATQPYRVEPYSALTLNFALKPSAEAALGTIQALVKDTGKHSAIASKTFAIDILPKLAVTVDKKAIRLTNSIGETLSGEVALESPQGWTIELPQTAFTAVPGETSSIPYSLVPSDGTTANGTLELAGTVIVGGESIPFRQTLSAVTASSASASAPVIDGTVETEWDTAPYALANTAAQVSADYRSTWNPDSLSADLQLKWDASKIYVLARVKDDTAFQPQSGGGMWQGDSLQLGFDVRNAAGSGYGPQVYELQIGKPDGAAPQIFKGMGFAKSGLMESGEIAVVRDEANKTTIYELSIPIAELEGFGTAASKKAVGFSYLVNDNDGSGRKGYIEWSSGIGGAKSASQFGTLWLN